METEAGSGRAIAYAFCAFVDEVLHVLDDTPVGNAHWRFRFCQWCNRQSAVPDRDLVGDVNEVVDEAQWDD
jgi:hypothetical protein